MNPNHSNSAHVPEPCAIVIFGATGDLTKRKLLPALYNLAASGLLPRQFAIIGQARSAKSDESFRAELTADLTEFATTKVDPQIWAWFVERIHYVQGDVADPAMYHRLAEKLVEVDKDHGTQGNRVFYLAIAPQFFRDAVVHLGAAGLTGETNGQYARVVIEKPFGRDVNSARELNRDVRKILEEKQVYRIDHYLGKETVQNLLVFRFSNSICEPLWNRNFIDHVQITAAETVGVEHRGGYYDASGALRDMVPNHLFQLLSLVAMEPPISFAADAVRDKQSEVLRSIQPPCPQEACNDAVRGQYGPALDGDAPGYRHEPDVPPDSNTETFVALKLNIDNWRWADVPFYLRTGKRLAERVTEITIVFRRTPFMLFRNTTVKDLQPNKLVIHIQPQEGISWQIGAKIPGPVMRIGQVTMDFDYAREFHRAPQTGYERLLLDCMLGDQTLFQRADMVETAWSVIDPILQAWKAQRGEFPNYAAGSWGPEAASALIARDGRHWNHTAPETVAQAEAQPAAAKQEA